MDIKDFQQISDGIPALADVSKPIGKAKSDLVYVYIRDLIMRNILVPGQKISEEEIASMLKTSRTPVREALRRLGGEGLVTLYPRCHAEVTCFSEDMIRHIGYVRLALDILSGQLAIHYGSDADFRKLEQLAEECEKAFASKDLYSAIVADRNFHLAITGISKNDILLRYEQANYHRLHLLQLQYSVLLDERDKRVNFHQTLIDTLSRRDSAGLVAAICDRYSYVYKLEPSVVEIYKISAALK